MLLVLRAAPGEQNECGRGARAPGKIGMAQLDMIKLSHF